jgi:hypothetical protein
MSRFHTSVRLLCLATNILHASSFTPLTFLKPSAVKTASFHQMSTESTESHVNDFNAVHVAKTGGRGAVSTAQDALDKDLSLGAPGTRPQGGHFLTRGGVQVTAQVNPLKFVKKSVDVFGEEVVDTSASVAAEGTSLSAIEDLVNQLDTKRGVLLSSSYEFPGR